MSSDAVSVPRGSCKSTEFPPVKLEPREKRLDGDWEQMDAVIFDAPPSKVFELWFANEGQPNQVRYMEESGDKECKVPHWDDNEDNVLTRELSTEHKLGPFGTIIGSPYSIVISDQKLYRLSADHFVVTAKITTRGFSIGETFETDADEEFVLLPPDEEHPYPRCELRQSFRIRFVKWTMLKIPLRVAVASENRASNKGVTDFLTKLVDAEKETVSGGS